MHVGRHGHPSEVLLALRGDLGAVGPLDDVVHPRSHPEPARAGDVAEHHAVVVADELLGAKRGLQRRRGARVGLDRRGWLVGDQLRLDDEARGAVDRLDLVQDRRDGPLDEGHQSGARESDLATHR